MVYFIQGKITQRIKIGWTKCRASERIKVLQTGSPDKLSVLLEIDGTSTEEMIIRSYLKKSRVFGEWFEPTAEVMSLIARIKNNKKRIPDDVLFFCFPKRSMNGIKSLPVPLLMIVKKRAKEMGIKCSEYYQKILESGIKRRNIKLLKSPK